MTRSRKSARDAGARFEREQAEYIQSAFPGRSIERRVRNGAKDRGDIGGVRNEFTGGAVVIECKDTARMELPKWWREAQTERTNDGAEFGIIMHKRHGEADPAQQWVTMDAATFVRLIGGRFDHPEPDDPDTPLPGLE